MADDQAAEWCGAQKNGSAPCSEPPGHKGDHIARDPFGNILRRWRNRG